MCDLPAYLLDYSAITLRNFNSAAKNIYKDVASGEAVNNPYNGHMTFTGRVSYVDYWSGLINFNSGLQQINDLSDVGIDFCFFEWLAQNAVSSNSGGKKVVVKNTGNDGSGPNGCYTTYDFNNGGQGEDNGNTLVVFNTTDDICLTETNDGRPFGPSVIAPFSKVTLTNAGFLDGYVVAREFTTVYGSDKGHEQQLHGDGYTGNIVCI